MFDKCCHVHIPAYSSLFQSSLFLPFLAYFSLFHPIPVYYSLIQPILAYLSLLKGITGYSSLFQPNPSNSSLFKYIQAYSSQFQPIPANSSLFQPILACTICITIWEKCGLNWASSKARVTLVSAQRCDDQQIDQSTRQSDTFLM